MVFDDQTNSIKENILLKLIPHSHWDGHILRVKHWSTDLSKLDFDIASAFPGTRISFANTLFIRSSNIHLLPQPVVAKQLQIEYDASYVRTNVCAHAVVLDMNDTPMDDELKHFGVDKCITLHINCSDRCDMDHCIELAKQTLIHDQLMGSDVRQCDSIIFHHDIPNILPHSTTFINLRVKSIKLDDHQLKFMREHPENWCGSWFYHMR